MEPITSEFDDFLALAGQPLDRARLVVFCGESGSGKSTYLHHPDSPARPEDAVVIASGALNAPLPAVRGRTVVLDEIWTPPHLGIVLRLLRNGNRVLAASHLPPASFAPFRLRWRVAAFRTDRGSAKIERFLDRAGVRYTPAAVERYCRDYGATYTDAEIILNHFPDNDFDRAFAQFRKWCTLTKTKSAR